MLAITVLALVAQCTLVLGSSSVVALGDAEYVVTAGNDWIDPNYLMAAAQSTDPIVNAAKLGILADASSSAQGGPWCKPFATVRA